MNASTQNQQEGLNRDFATGRVFSENAIVINRAGGIIPGARPGWWTRVAIACQKAVNYLAPIGYEDETGFHYGRQARVEYCQTCRPFWTTRPHLKICIVSPFKAICLCSALWESVWMKAKSKLPKRSGGFDKKSKKERPSQTTIFRYERGKETTSPPRSKSGK
jgi:hypothetical protein